MLRVLLVSRCGQEEGREERPHRLVPKLGLMLDCTKFGAAPTPYNAAARVAPMFEAAAFTLCSSAAAPRICYVGRLFFAGTKDGSLRRPLAPGSPDVSRHLLIARFAGRTRNASGL